MIKSDVIIVGGGPAGSTCAWKLRQHGMDCVILDKQQFPRNKLCAGWVTPQIFKNLHISPKDYPHELTTFDHFIVHWKNKQTKIPVNQYAIRRIEFDNWLLKRSQARIIQHNVQKIRKEGLFYFIDEKFQCRFLVGAGGTFCPVYNNIFKNENPRCKEKLVVTMETEFKYQYEDSSCHLWFLQNYLPGYSWYVPKTNGYLNIGIGGYGEKLKATGDTIVKQWAYFSSELKETGLVRDYPLDAKGYNYYIRGAVDTLQIDNAFLIGDAAGLATNDMGEGIGPAIQSGLLAAESIINGKPYSIKTVKKSSFSKFKIMQYIIGAYFKKHL